MQRGGDDLNLVLAFPPPGDPRYLQNVKNSRRHYSRHLSMFQLDRITFYENIINVFQISSSRSDFAWHSSESIEHCGGAFWGMEVAQFLSCHR